MKKNAMSFICNTIPVYFGISFSVKTELKLRLFNFSSNLHFQNVLKEKI